MPERKANGAGAKWNFAVRVQSKQLSRFAPERKASGAGAKWNFAVLMLSKQVSLHRLRNDERHGHLNSR